MSRLLNYFGRGGLVVVLGMVLGFYAADQGLPWLPTMLEIILAVCAVSIGALVLGRWLRVGNVHSMGNRRPRRGRFVLLGLLVAAIVVGWWALEQVKQPSALTSLLPEQFDEAFEIDTSRYVECDRGIEQLLTELEQQDVFDVADNPAADDSALTPDEETYLRDVWAVVYDYAFALDQIRFFYEDWYRFDPSRAQRSFHVRSFLLTFAAELSLYEKTTRLVHLVSRNDNAVRFLNAPDPAHGQPENSFSMFREQLLGIKDASRVVAGEQYLNWLAKGLKGREEARAVGCSWLWNKVEKELSLIEAVAPTELVTQTVASDLEVFRRKIDRQLWYPTVKGVAEWMGDTRVRRIGSYLVSSEQLQQLGCQLKPGDILLARKNWYLSNVGLPGFWPHAMLYVGTPAQFDAYFADDDVQEWVRQVAGEDMSLGEYIGRRYPLRYLRYRSGGQAEHSIIEAVGGGVDFNSVDLLTVDYLAALRPRLDKLAKAQAIVAAFDHLDKPYDFDFDFATDHALVCTELVWRSYRPADGKAGLEFDMVEIAGRGMLPANEIARLFADEYGRDGAQLELVCFLDGREKERIALPRDSDAFAATWQRSKWDIAAK